MWHNIDDLSGHVTRKISFRCKWKDCPQLFTCNNNMMDHILDHHVKVQKLEKGSFYCGWKNCHVMFAKINTMTWLESHVVAHGGSTFKAYRCQVLGCNSRLGTKRLLAKHELLHRNTHSKNELTRLRANETLISDELQNFGMDIFHKMIVFQPRDIVMKEYDRFIEEALKFKLQLIKSKNIPIDLGIKDANVVTFTCEIISKRELFKIKSKPQLCIRWIPYGIFDDEWIHPINFNRIRHVKLRDLSDVQKYKLLMKSVELLEDAVVKRRSPRLNSIDDMSSK